MPRHFFGNPYAGGDIAIPDGRWRAFAIGAESEYDAVRIDGRICAAGRVLPLVVDGTPTVSMGARDRGPRSSTWAAHVIGWECGEQIVAPGPRAPREYVFPKLALPAWAANMVGAAEMVVPFVGRRAARVLVNVNGSESISWVAYLRKHFSLEPSLSTMASTTLDIPAEVAYSKSSPRSTATPAVGGDFMEGANIGGTDSFESADELVIFASAAAGETSAGANAVFIVEVFGDLGCA